MLHVLKAGTKTILFIVTKAANFEKRLFESSSGNSGYDYTTREDVEKSVLFSLIVKSRRWKMLRY